MCDQELLSLREEVKQLKTNKVQLEDSAQQRDVVISALKTNISQLQHSVDQRDNEISDLKMKITQLEVAVAALTSDIVNLEAASRNHVSEINSLKSNKVQLEAEVKTRERIFSEKEKEMNTLRVDLENINKVTTVIIIIPEFDKCLKSVNLIVC